MGKLISAIFLVAGTCIGGGMLALPVATGLSGFLPSLAVMALSWVMMTLTALLLLEVSLWMEEGVHIITMSSRLLGPIGRNVSWVLYLFICYASLVAYTAGGGVQIVNSIGSFFDVDATKPLGCLIFMFLFGSVIYLGHNVVGRVNAILFIAMIVAYVALVGMGLDEVNPKNLERANWRYGLMALPLLLTSFSFQTMVPSLTPYLKRNAANLRRAIIWGTSLAFVVYLIWQAIILGIVPLEGEAGLLQALKTGEPATQFISSHVHGPYIAWVAEYFAFFALVTSFLGIALGLFDFLSDGLKIKERGWGQVGLALLVIVPTFFFAAYYERAFIVALDASGGFGDSILNGIIPCLMVWMGRYKLGYKGLKMVPGEKWSLSLILAFYIITVIFVILMQMNLVNSIFNIGN